MSGPKHYVTIKGVKDGLVFLLNDSCDFTVLIKDLKHKVEKTHNQILTGPIVHVSIKLGKRIVSPEQKEEITRVIRQRGNLIIQSIETQPVEVIPALPIGVSNITVKKGIIRSGQTVHHNGNLLYIGDINPGGIITCTGDILIMGSLKGVAHAGSEGNIHSVIAASHLKPTQLRIADVISRPPDEWGFSESYLEFAYLIDGKMNIEKTHDFYRIRPDSCEF